MPRGHARLQRERSRGSARRQLAIGPLRRAVLTGPGAVRPLPDFRTLRVLDSRSGLLGTSGLGRRARERWKAKLLPITLQESRHTAATWLDAAGVPPKIASVLMGHATPMHQPGAAQITLARYTHALPEDIEQARQKLSAYLAKRDATKAVATDPVVPPAVPPALGPQ
jgi:integrase